MKCVDCGEEVNKNDYYTRPRDTMDTSADPLCQPCWQKAFKAKYGSAPVKGMVNEEIS